MTEAQEIANYLESRLEKGFRECNIPDYMHDGIRNYVLHGIQPGDFLTAVLENDLRGAVEKADYNNILLLKYYIIFMINFMPSISWGNDRKVLYWIKERSNRRILEEDFKLL